MYHCLLTLCSLLSPYALKPLKEFLQRVEPAISEQLKRNAKSTAFDGERKYSLLAQLARRSTYRVQGRVGGAVVLYVLCPHSDRGLTELRGVH